MFLTVNPKNFLSDRLTWLSRGMKREMTHFTSFSSSVVNVFHGNWSAVVCNYHPHPASQILIILYFPAPQTISGCHSLTFYIVLKPQTPFCNCLPLLLSELVICVVAEQTSFVRGFVSYVTKIILHICVVGNLMSYTCNAAPQITGALYCSDLRQCSHTQHNGSL